MPAQYPYHLENIPRMRRFTLDAGYLGHPRYMVHGLLEVDVNEAHRIIRQVKQESGERLSLLKIAIYLLLWISILTACAPTATPGGQSSATPAETTSTRTVTGPKPTNLPGTGLEVQVIVPPGAVIVFQRSGGIAGLDEKWIIYNNGRLVSAEGKDWQVDPREVASLVSQIEELGFSDLRGSYLEWNSCCDRFSYILTLSTGGNEKTVTWVEANPEIPASLLEIQEYIQGFIQDGSGQT